MQRNLPALYPLRLRPYLSKPIWGGTYLARTLHKSQNPLDHIGESWEIYADSPIEYGSLSGQTLDDVLHQYGEQLVGCRAHDDALERFPLLIKLIDAEQPLSVQVHPNDEQARLLEGQPFGKTEAWHIIQARDGASLIYGLSVLLTREELKARALTGALEHSLQYLSIHPGDTISVPAGTIHAIGSGIVLYEVQQTSETTYRLYDWKRVDAQGNPRELHLEKAAQVVDLTVNPEGLCIHQQLSPFPNERALLVQTAYFVLERWHVGETWEVHLDGSSFLAVTCLAGTVRVQSLTESPDELLYSGQTLLLPASLRSIVYKPVPSAVLLIAKLPN
ncbi:MAG: class I mannose-6-phosphate isomerase [Chloroflexi bacterium]|nr:class I mannose-6-phosphate isomerase [Chloroflexota bacterium]